MSEPDDTTAGLERALTQTQRQERDERDADLARQAEAAENLIEVLSRKDAEGTPA